MLLFKLYFIFFDEVLILKNFSRKACFDNAPEELSTFLAFFNRLFHNVLIKFEFLCANKYYLLLRKNYPQFFLGITKIAIVF